MGTFRHSIVLVSADGTRMEQVEALVDTGSTFTWIPRGHLERLGVTPSFREEFETIDGRVIEREMSTVLAHLEGQMLPTLVVFGDIDSEPVIGAYTLEGFRLAADPVNRRLMHVRGLLMSTRPKVESVDPEKYPRKISFLFNASLPGEAMRRTHTGQSIGEMFEE